MNHALEPERPVAATEAASPAARHVAALWAAALSLAALGTAICFDALPGSSWGIWTLAAAACLVAFVRRARKRQVGEIMGLALLAVIVAFGAAFTSNPGLHLLIVATTGGLLALATLLASGTGWRRVGGAVIISAPFVAFFRAVREAARRVAEATTIVKAERSLPVLRGIAIALPVTVLFALMLSSADPVLDAARSGALRMLARLEFVPRTIFFSVLSVIALGAFGLAVRPAPQTAPPSAGTKAGALQLGDTERLMALGSVAALFALFLLLQLSYLFGNAPAVQGSGVTFADFARRGFGELTVVATLCTLLILGLDRVAAPGGRVALVRAVELMLVAELQLLLASAFHRVSLYEAAYGFTTARLYAQVYMIVMGLTLLLLGREIWMGIDVSRLARAAAVLGTTAITALTYWNHEGWIAQQNVERFRETGKIDVRYLAYGLSLDAVPMVVRILPELDSATATELRDRLHGSHHHRAEALDWRWFEWNLRRKAGIDALRRVGIEPGSEPARSHEEIDAQLRRDSVARAARPVGASVQPPPVP